MSDNTNIKAINAPRIHQAIIAKLVPPRLTLQIPQGQTPIFRLVAPKMAEQIMGFLTKQ